MSDEPEHRNWLELPRDVTASILSRLGAFEILESAQKVCLLWRDICKDHSLWRTIDMRGEGFGLEMDSELVKMCMHAIDRSQGELVDLNIECFCSDDLLSYIPQRANGLRRLRLFGCYSISDEALGEAAAKLPLLEELELTHCGSLSEAVVAVVGRCCPNLKTFKLNCRVFKHASWEIDEEAQAIAENMHELRHLQLLGNLLTNRGLLAILDGCPHLESLDLRQCFNIKLEGDLEKRCVKQIKHLQRPHDSAKDCLFGGSDEDEDESGMSDDDYDYHDDYELEFSDEYPLEYDDYFEEYYMESMLGLSIDSD